MSAYLLFTPSTERKGWSRFLTSLARAERAAAEQCDLIAIEMDRIGRPELAETYREIGCEEREHIKMVQHLCRETTDLPARAEAAYQGKYLSSDPTLVERMAVFHLAFEISALAFLGYLYSRVEKHFHDKDWAREVRQTCAEILKQEVGHVSAGKAMVLDLLSREDEATRQTVAKSLRRHYTFLRVGLKSFFDQTDHPFLQEMTKNYERHYHRAIEGVV